MWEPNGQKTILKRPFPPALDHALDFQAWNSSNIFGSQKCQMPFPVGNAKESKKKCKKWCQRCHGHEMAACVGNAGIPDIFDAFFALHRLPLLEMADGILPGLIWEFSVTIKCKDHNASTVMQWRRVGKHFQNESNCP